jgi:hypothetical protein
LGKTSKNFDFLIIIYEHVSFLLVYIVESICTLFNNEQGAKKLLLSSKEKIIQ